MQKDGIKRHEEGCKCLTCATSRQIRKEIGLGPFFKDVLSMYRAVDQWLTDGQFTKCDDFLRNAQVDKLSVDELLGMLTVTLRYHGQLPSRPKFFLRVEESFKQRGESEAGLLVGLG